MRFLGFGFIGGYSSGHASPDRTTNSMPDNLFRTSHVRDFK